MPQVNKGGKFIFGWSAIRPGGSVVLPASAVNEYDMTSEGRVILFSGSKSTGGFCVTRHGLLETSKLSGILNDNSRLNDYLLGEGEFIQYKGRFYCWARIDAEGKIILAQSMLKSLNLKEGMKLFAIRSSNIAFTMGARGPLLERIKGFTGKIEEY